MRLVGFVKKTSINILTFFSSKCFINFDLKNEQAKKLLYYYNSRSSIILEYYMKKFVLQKKKKYNKIYCSNRININPKPINKFIIFNEEVYIFRIS